MTDQGSNKTGPARDNELKKEMQGDLKANRAVRVEEQYEPQPSGEDQPLAARQPTGSPAGAPAGMTPQDVIVRSELARHLERSVYPADRDTLLASLRRHQAPDGLTALVSRLPAADTYPNLQGVVTALGLGAERGRG
ncbi:DUF2795 domain-containing protein [Actinacidiphila alni]|uniref:DUF2795 domain-containing protein n=1 Tax=Actinacidiphila alni TaxID=380248 RepID=UPI0033F51152